MRFFMTNSSALLLVLLSMTLLPFSTNGELTITSNGHDDLLEMLNTEQALIDGLRHFIQVQEQKLNILRSKTQDIQNIYDEVGDDRESYLNNPINTVTMLKRITSDWKGMTNDAEDYLDTEELSKNITQQQELTFPSEDDYESALISLLRIQDMFQLQPQRLSVGEVNGVKLGSEMSWSDCLEIGLKSSKSGYQTYAKYWMETALSKIPQVGGQQSDVAEDKENNTTTTSTSQTAKEYNIKARIEVMRALLNVEYKAGNLETALKIANEMLEINPKQKNVLNAVKQIKKDMKKSNLNEKKKDQTTNEKKTPIKKTDEELMIEEICREATTSQQMQQIHTAQLESVSAALPVCSLVTNNLPWLMLQPLQVELLSLDPFIVIYHETLSGNQLEELKEFVVDKEDTETVDDSLQLTKIGLKKIRQINEKLYTATGHGREALDARDWHLNRYNFENIMEVDSTPVQRAKTQAGVLFNLQQPLLGGSIIFPQLQLSVNLPKGSLLYWSNLNEFGSPDYRSKYHICPVIGGSQLTANAFMKLP